MDWTEMIAWLIVAVLAVMRVNFAPWYSEYKAARADRDIAESRLAEVEDAIASRCASFEGVYCWCKRYDCVARECLPCFVQGFDSVDKEDAHDDNG